MWNLSSYWWFGGWSENIKSLDEYTVGESEDEATDDESDPFEDIDVDDMD